MEAVQGLVDAIDAGLLDFIDATYDAVGWPVAVLIMAIESAATPLPSEIIMPLAAGSW